MPNTTHQDKLTEILSYPRLRRACAVELCDAWRTAQWDAIRAYADWCAAPPATRQNAYVAYVAAADRESAAAGVWQACCRADGCQGRSKCTPSAPVENAPP